jgi:hypothetical protein
MEKVGRPLDHLRSKKVAYRHETNQNPRREAETIACRKRKHD